MHAVINNLKRNKMEKHFCNYNQSLALKELGFNEPCFAYYQKSAVIGNDTILPIQIMDKSSNFNDVDYSKIGVPFWSAPLKSQVFEWARKEHKIHCSYGTTSDSREEVNGYCISNFIDGNRNYLHIDWEVGTYDEAESACIDKLIEIIKKK